MYSARFTVLLVCLVSCSVAGLGCSDSEDPIGPGILDTTSALDGQIGVDGLTSPTRAPDTTSVQQDVEDEFAKPCNGPADCPSGWCVESPEGQVCTTTCFSECPTGWECREVTSASGDPIYICISLLARLCHPCAEDTDCSEAASTGKNRCVTNEDNGSFCGIACATEKQVCPEGYQCDTALDEPQCVPDTGECTCNGLATMLGLSTTCSQGNDIGTCVGKRACSVDGLTDCDAAEPADESCNNVDDDCDGVTDEALHGGPCALANEHGTCVGTLNCESGGKSCLGQDPGPEECNGIDDNCDGATDEGFSDLDGDKLADCVDDDSDGDGTLNINDCNPMDPTVFPGALEICDDQDNDCNNAIDEEGAVGCNEYYADVDQDTYGADKVKPRCLCQPDPGSFYTVQNGDDCNDLNPFAFPGGQEICNAQDDDCDGEVDEIGDLPACAITNGFGSCPGQMACLKGVFICDGQTPLPEECNGVDDDCNGVTDEGEIDSDFDGQADCADDDDDNDGTVDVLDCEPFNPDVHKDAQETCNGVDENCNGIDDDEGAKGCQWYYQDADKDGFGADSVEPRCFCSAQELIYFTADAAGDCNDISYTSHPGSEEVCNALDDNCDGNIDEWVASPCGGCDAMCVMEVGGGKDLKFELNAFNSSNVIVTASGSLMLDTSNGLMGYYRQTFKGWPVNNTYWDFMVANVTLPGDGVSVIDLRFRAAPSDVELVLADWIYAPEAIPPGAFPVNFDLEGMWFEVEITLKTGDPNAVPIVDNITIIASEME